MSAQDRAIAATEDALDLWSLISNSAQCAASWAAASVGVAGGATVSGAFSVFVDLDFVGICEGGRGDRVQ